MVRILPFVYFAFAAILVGGGAMGSKVSGKASSLTGSLVFALGAVVAGIITRSNAPTGLLIGLIDALAVAAFFVYRFVSTGKPFPAAPSILLSLIVAGLTVAAMLAAKRPG